VGEVVEGDAMGRLQKGLGRVVPAAVLTATEEAAQIRARAEADAATIRTEAQAARAEAERAGFEAGKQEGMAQVSALLLAARAQAERDLDSAKDAAIVLARRMAERIVGRAIELSPGLMGAIVGEAMVASRARTGTVVLRAHPEDLAAIERERPRWLARVAAGVDVRVVADPAIGRYGCVVETAVGRLDARLETQLDALERALRGSSGASGRDKHG
jgi:flagellar biosynthesis/type III secretory pathway protein FliH